MRDWRTCCLFPWGPPDKGVKKKISLLFHEKEREKFRAKTTVIMLKGKKHRIIYRGQAVLPTYDDV